MIIVKNTYGVGVALDPRISNLGMLDRLSGSSIDRKTYPKKAKNKIFELLDSPLDEIKEEKKLRLRSMSPRTKTKIRKKILALSRLGKTLTFLTLTFANAVEDKKAIRILQDFLDNALKQDRNFEYLWVAEKQSKNKAFKDNIHFHIITTKFWKIDKWWKYWLELQARHGITPRDKSFNPSSAFDVKHVHSNNVKGISTYLTKYITKNTGHFDCQIWNCSKKISRLYTDFYTDIEFIREFERLETGGQLGGKLKVYFETYCNVHIIPLNKTTLKFYTRLDNKNKTVWSCSGNSEKTLK